MGVDEGFAAFDIVDPGVGNVGVHAGEGVLAYKACDVFVGDEIRGIWAAVGWEGRVWVLGVEVTAPLLFRMLVDTLSPRDMRESWVVSVFSEGGEALWGRGVMPSRFDAGLLGK